MTINISWEWALGLLITLGGALITITWKCSARFTALETSVEWIKNVLKDLKVNADNASGTPAFGSRSPIKLTSAGEQWLEESGLKQYIDLRQDEFLKIHDDKNTNPYEIQTSIFEFFDSVKLDLNFDEKLKKFAFSKGTTIDVMRRVGAIYLRDLCLNKFGMKNSDIDKHDPNKIQS